MTSLPAAHPTGHPAGLVNIFQLSGESHGALASLGGGVSSINAAANRAHFFPFRITRPYTVLAGLVKNGATASNNLDIGVYLPDGTRLASSGSTAQAGTTALQYIVMSASVVLQPGLYYAGLVMDGTTGTINRITTLTTVQCRGLGMFTMNSAFPLPATATFAAYATSNYVQIFGLSMRSFG